METNETPKQKAIKRWTPILEQLGLSDRKWCTPQYIMDMYDPDFYCLRPYLGDSEPEWAAFRTFITAHQDALGPKMEFDTLLPILHMQVDEHPLMRERAVKFAGDWVRLSPATAPDWCKELV